MEIEITPYLLILMWFSLGANLKMLADESEQPISKLVWWAGCLIIIGYTLIITVRFHG